MRTRLKLFTKWGITFEKPYILPERVDRSVRYANREDLEQSIAAAMKKNAEKKEVQNEGEGIQSENKAETSISIRSK